MTFLTRILKPIVTAFCLILVISAPISAQSAQSERLDRLYEELADTESRDWQLVVADIWQEWSHSGSASMDLLLERGLMAMDSGDIQTAIEHLTALTDHAPDFAEGWNARATAYFQAGLFGPAIEDIRRTLVLNPRHFGALSGMGMILEELGYNDTALQAFKEVQTIHPRSEGIEAIILRLEKKVGGTDL